MKKVYIFKNLNYLYIEGKASPLITVSESQDEHRKFSTIKHACSRYQYIKKIVDPERGEMKYRNKSLLSQKAPYLNKQKNT